MKKAIMIVGAAEEHCLGIRAAHDMGLRVFVTDGNPKSIGFSAADDYAVASTYDPEKTLQRAHDYLAKGGRIDGVMTLAADVSYTVAYVAKNLGLPGIGIESGLNASEKSRMKKCFQKDALPMPLFQDVGSPEHLRKFADEVDFPIVVKPIDSRGGRGVQLIKGPKELEEAFWVARSYSLSGRVIGEAYLEGPQLSTEGFIIDGKAYIPAIFDRNYEYLEDLAPFIVENGGEMPSVYSAEYRDEVHEVMMKAALALGIETGIVKGDLVIHKGQVKVIELAARMSGGFFATVATPVSCGVDLIKANIELCLHGTINPQVLEHKFERAAAIRFAFPGPGRVKRVSGFEQILQDSACRYANVFIKPGDLMEPITNHPARPAVVVAEGSCLEDAVSNAKRLVNMLHWEIESI